MQVPAPLGVTAPASPARHTHNLEQVSRQLFCLLAVDYAQIAAMAIIKLRSYFFTFSADSHKAAI